MGTDGEEVVALYRFWPKWKEAYPDNRSSADLARDLGIDILLLKGSYDLAIRFPCSDTLAMASSEALYKGALLTGKLPRGNVPFHEQDTRVDRKIDQLPPNLPMNLWRTRDGWNLVYAVSSDAWMTLSMGFLNRTLFEAYDDDPASAWHAEDVNRLATMVMDTHLSQDVEGTFDTYGVASASIRSWQDAEIGPSGETLCEALAWMALFKTDQVRNLRTYLRGLCIDLSFED